MITHSITDPSSDPASPQARSLALTAAVTLRDCSFRLQSSDLERKACRTLMREQALHWRRPVLAALPV